MTMLFAGKGVSNVDFVLYVSAVATDQCVENVAGQVRWAELSILAYKPKLGT